MTPDQLAKSGTEHAHQVALFAWCAVATLRGFDAADAWANTGLMPEVEMAELFQDKCIPELKWFHAIPNGGSRGDDAKSRAIRGGALKAEGVRVGIPDCFLPVPRGTWHGLYIEMKKPEAKAKKESSKGGVSDEQKEFGAFAKEQGYGWVVCYDWRSAANMVRAYMEC